MSLSVIGIAGTVFAAAYIARSDVADDRQAFEASSNQIASTLRLAVQRESDLVVAAGVKVSDSPNLGQRRFRHWFDQMAVFDRYPEFVSAGVISFVPASELDAVSARIEADPPQRIAPPGSLVVTPAGRRPFYCVVSAGVTRGSPQATTPAGTDYCANPNPVTNPVLASRDSGEGSYVPYALDGRDYLAVHVPVYRGGTTPKTVAGRRKAITAWIAILVLPAGLLDRALQGHPETAVTMRYRNASSNAAFTRGDAPAAGAQGRVLPLGGGWTARVSGPSASGAPLGRRDVVAILVGGIFISLVSGLLVFVLGTGRARALQMVRDKTGELSYLAMHDSLTGLPNRALVMDRAERMLAGAVRDPVAIAALFIDIDGFKEVNDSFGHAAGDEVLKAVGERLVRVVRGQDTVGRLGGDEFVVLIEASKPRVRPELVAERLIETLGRPIPLAGTGRSVSISASIGIAFGGPSGPDALLRDADLALYAAKAAGKNRYLLFDGQMQADAEERTELSFDLRTAVEDHQFFLQYQPTFDLHDRTVMGVEALIRWRHPTSGVIPPDRFIPLIEESGLIVPVGRWVLRQACQQAAAWHRDGHRIDMSVNVSAVQLNYHGLEDDVRGALRVSGLDPSRLTLEVTETALMIDIDSAAARLRALKDIGVRIAIDDFGTGYSSLAYLRQLPVDSLKIDRSFISAIGDSSESSAIIGTVVELAQSLNIETLAEGIEDERQLGRLVDERVDHGQGYLVARPLNAADVPGFLAKAASAEGCIPLPPKAVTTLTAAGRRSS